VTRSLAVLLGGHVVAQVERTRGGALRLTYTGAGDGTPLSLSLPAGSRTHVGAPVTTFLDALLPENASVRDAIARAHAVDARDLLDLLAVVGKDCAGAVQLCLPGEVEQTLARRGLLVPCSDAEIERRMAAMTFNEDASWTMPEEHWSLGGTQGKIALRFEGDAWYVADGAEPTTHIIKPGIRRLRAQALIEHLSMRAAQYLGLDVAHTEYTSFKSENAIVVTRFDRYRDQEGTVRRSHQEDICQALGTSKKYQQFGGPCAANVVRLLRDTSRTAAQARDNVARFLDALTYNTLIGAPGAHGRNYAVLLNGEDVQFAPLYDVATGLAYGQQDSQGVASMSIGGAYAFAEMNAGSWRRLGGDVGVDGEDLLSRARELAMALPAAMENALDELADDSDAREVRDRLQGALERHTRRVVSEP
jgi:serine/threonine-protein kinase HipA